MPNTDVPAAAERMPNNDTLADVQAEVWRLFHLLATISDLIMEFPLACDDRSEAELDRINALALIARDRARSLGLDIDQNFRAIERRAG
ncbi:hypothetical protein QO002_000904 [Pararhizobium capsulatum DSM 1112]|uniref:Uncharacterized protein n=1 Tax=Pararhizobium capsulatum DSM 1112 TaxID=1121113 RepID=A0ABU0BKI9_9HYPH|nr:hypothetical protein [Pararhizobium capsulatum]MDQ0318766.1 hypothetical protein [Pararhizobium capsulatum DSM 1112]